MAVLGTNAIAVALGAQANSAKKINTGKENFSANLGDIATLLSKGKLDKAEKLIDSLADDKNLQNKLKHLLEEARLTRELEDKRRRENEAVLQMRRAAQEARQVAKRRAREKIERIKKEIAMLKMMARLNPKAVARRLAQLARLLASAVKEFGGAGGTGLAEGGGAAAPNAASSNTATQGQATSGEGASFSSKPESGSQGEQTVAQEEKGDAHQPAQPDQHEKSFHEEQKERVLKTVATQAEKFAQQNEDREFMAEVRSLKRQLKEILEMVKKELKERHNDANNQDVKDVERDLQGIESNLTQLELGSVNLSVNVSVSMNVNVTV